MDGMNYNINGIENLTEIEYIEVNGGQLSTDTSLSYDVGYWLGKGGRLAYRTWLKIYVPTNPDAYN